MLLFTNTNLAKGQFISVRMFFGTYNESGPQLGEVCKERSNRIDFKPKHGQMLGKFFWAQVTRVDVVL